MERNLGVYLYKKHRCFNNCKKYKTRMKIEKLSTISSMCLRVNFYKNS